MLSFQAMVHSPVMSDSTWSTPQLQKWANISTKTTLELYTAEFLQLQFYFSMIFKVFSFMLQISSNQRYSTGYF